MEISLYWQPSPFVNIIPQFFTSGIGGGGIGWIAGCGCVGGSGWEDSIGSGVGGGGGHGECGVGG